MSIVLTRSPLEPIGMNGGGAEKRRSARLSQEGNGENEPPAKKTKMNGAATSTSTVNTKQQDGEGSKAAAKRKRKVYDEEDDGFTFSKGKRGKAKEAKKPAASKTSEEAPVEAPVASAPSSDQQAAPSEDPAPKTAQKKTRRRFPTTPERDDADKPVRRSKRLSNEKEPEKAPEPSPQRPSHAKSHANTHRGRSPSPAKARPLTVEKKRRHGANGVEEEKVMMISLPFADTPIIKRNKEMRKTSAEGSRRSSAGMRGKRASSLIDEGRGHALPHDEVPAAEFFKHISADLTEPRRMRCLLGWCGSRALPSKPEPPKEGATASSSLEFQAIQAARIIQDEVSQELITNGTLSEWFSRDESATPQIPLRKKPNPRNVTNAAKAEELERELERLKEERAEWDELEQSGGSAATPAEEQPTTDGQVPPLRPEVLDSPQRAIFEQLQSSAAEFSTDPVKIQERLQTISGELEFGLDQFAHGIHALSTTRETAEKVAERSLADAANVLEEREKQRAASGKPVDQMDALRGLARVLNSQYR